MILAGQMNEFLIIAIVAVLVIAVGLLVYYIVTGRKAKNNVQISPNFETKNVETLTQEVGNNRCENGRVQDEVIPQTGEIIPQAEEVNTNEDFKEAERALEEGKTDNSIQTLLNQMQQDLDKSNAENYADSINHYEDEEEANAIISYKELMKYKDSPEKEVVLEDKNKEEIKEVIKDSKPKEEVKKFKRSEFISPIFGYNEDTNVTYREIKRPPRKEKNNMDEWESDHMLKNLEDDTIEIVEFGEKPKEIDKNDRFLDELVDFRNKLN